MNRVLFCAVIAFTIAALMWGFSVVGGPGYARMEKHDLELSRGLQQIHSYLLCRKSTKVLPATLGEKNYCANRTPPEIDDPATGAPYMYRRISDTEFEICATFMIGADIAKFGHSQRSLRFDKSLSFDGLVGCRTGELISDQAGFQPMDQFIISPKG